jgi:trigger factor
MQVSIETTSALERRVTVGVPAERVESEVNARLQRAAKTARLNGFRPGKVPMSVIRKRFGDGVRQEVVGEVMSQSFYEAVQQEKLKPAGRPNIEPTSLEPGKDLQYIATFEVFPEVELRDHVSIEVVKPVAEVGEQDVENMIETLRKQAGTWVEVSRPAQDGDQVTIDFAGTRDGEPFEGGSAEGSALVLGSKRMIPGFEDAIVGMNVGEEKAVPLTFPEDYHSEALKGAAVEFKIKLHAIREQQPAELNEEFFERFGVREGGVDAFRTEVASNMARELKNAVTNRVKNQVMDGLVALYADLRVPKALISDEIGTLRNQTVQQFGGGAQGIDFAQLLPDEMFAERAERRVKLGLILNEIVAKEEIKVDPAEVRKTVEEMASTYEDPQEVVEWYYSNRQQMQGVESLVLENQVVTALLERAQVKEENMSYDDVMKVQNAQREA